MRRILLLSVFALTSVNCGSSDKANPFLDDSLSDESKFDTYYQNPYGKEVEVDLEGEMRAEAGDSAIRLPAIIAQYAMTYMRKRGDFYLESLAEDRASASTRAEFRVDDRWLTAEEAKNLDASKLTHWRLRGMNAVLLNDDRDNVRVGKEYKATVPLKPSNLFATVQNQCADYDSHIHLDQSVYWYLWNPQTGNCTAETQELSIKVSKTLPTSKAYPEYDKLIEDGLVSGVVLFGQIGDGPINDNEAGVRNMKQMAEWLKADSFKEVANAPVGRRFEKTVKVSRKNIKFQMDLYSPNDFSGLGDYAHFDNLQKAISEHEIIVYDGHSMLGASDFWSRPEYPSFYQIFIYGGCLGYEYYVRPIVEKKNGWDNLDLLSSTVEVSADANDIAGPILSRIFKAIQKRSYTSYRTILAAVHDSVGDATFGASGVRENKFKP